MRSVPDGPRPSCPGEGRPDLTIHHLRHTALTLAGQNGATDAELQARAGHASQAVMAIWQNASLEEDRSLAEKIGQTYSRWGKATVLGFARDRPGPVLGCFGTCRPSRP